MHLLWCNNYVQLVVGVWNLMEQWPDRRESATDSLVSNASVSCICHTSIHSLQGFEEMEGFLFFFVFFLFFLFSVLIKCMDYRSVSLFKVTASCFIVKWMRSKGCKCHTWTIAPVNNLGYIEWGATWRWTIQINITALHTVICLNVWVEPFDRFVKVKFRSRWWHFRTVRTVPLIIFCPFNLLTEDLIDLLTLSSKSPHLKCSRRAAPACRGWAAYPSN